MAKRSYDQYCAAARALDVVGDRWTLLMIRELLLGPKRYTDLLEALPGIGTNLLAERLRTLSAAGVVRRRDLPPPAASTVYELTDRGRALEPVVVGLARWGLELLGRYDGEAAWRPEWSVLAMRATFRPDAAADVAEAYRFRIDGEVFHAVVDHGRVATDRGPGPEPAVTVEADRDTFLAVASSAIPLEEAVEAGDYRVEGDMEALRRFGEIFSLPA